MKSTVDLIIKNGLVYFSGSFVQASIAVEDGKIVAIGKESKLLKADREIDARSNLVLPGMIDTHASFRDPGYPESENFTTGSMAAAAGGVTMVMDTAHTM